MPRLGDAFRRDCTLLSLRIRLGVLSVRADWGAWKRIWDMQWVGCLSVPVRIPNLVDGTPGGRNVHIATTTRSILDMIRYHVRAAWYGSVENTWMWSMLDLISNNPTSSSPRYAMTVIPTDTTLLSPHSSQLSTPECCGCARLFNSSMR